MVSDGRSVAHPFARPCLTRWKPFFSLPRAFFIPSSPWWHNLVSFHRTPETRLPLVARDCRWIQSTPSRHACWLSIILASCHDIAPFCLSFFFFVPRLVSPRRASSRIVSSGLVSSRLASPRCSSLLFVFSRVVQLREFSARVTRSLFVKHKFLLNANVALNAMRVTGLFAFVAWNREEARCDDAGSSEWGRSSRLVSECCSPPSSLEQVERSAGGSTWS